MTLGIISDWRQIKFKQSNAKNPNDFYPELKRRVEAYFTENKFSKQGSNLLFSKALLLIGLDIIIYTAILSNFFSFWGVFTLFILFGINTCLICMNITHDILHSSFFKNKKWNKYFSYFFDLNGFSSLNWSITHNFEHHTFTNIAGIDHDIDKLIWLRLAPTDAYYRFHKFQHLYALPLYMFTTLNWIFYSDYILLNNFRKMGKTTGKDIALFFLFKVLYVTIFLAIPMAILNLAWWQTVICFLVFSMSGGFLAAVIFQLAHVVEGVDYPLPDSEGNIENLWAVHQLKTTSNFATRSRWILELFGGLNFQIEHHLFPHVSHVHYYAISPIVRKTAYEYGLPYHEHMSLFQAITSHLKILKRLGREKN